MVSVIIPAYNAEKYIRQAINSVLEQVYTDIEIIVVDDGSTDNTAGVVRQFKNVKYIFQENKGPASARNAGIEVSKGEFVAFLDADDLYLPNKILEQVECLQSAEDADIVYNDIQMADEALKPLKVLTSEGIYNDREDFLCMLLFRQIVPTPPSIMLRRRCIDEGYRYNESYRNAEDYDFLIQLAQRYKFKYIEKTLYVYRRHSDNLTNSMVKQHENELNILRSIGFEEIEGIVDRSHFSSYDKKFLLSKIYFKLSEYLRAKEVLEYLRLNYPNNYVLFYLGNCCYYLDEYGKAADYYKQALEVEPNMAEAYNNLGCIYANNSDAACAKRLFQKALNAKEGYMDAEYNLSQILNGKTEFKFTKLELRKQLMFYT